MSLKNREIVSILNNLIEVCKDGEQGFKDASDDVKDPVIQQILLKFSEARGMFYIELQSMVKKLGGEVEFGGSILGILHRRWMDVRFGVVGSNTEGILNECQRGEKSALNSYKKYLASDLPENIKTFLQRQYNEIFDVFQYLQKLSQENGFELKVHLDFPVN